MSLICVVMISPICIVDAYRCSFFFGQTSLKFFNSMQWSAINNTCNNTSYTSTLYFKRTFPMFLCSVVAQCDSCVYPEVKVFFQNSHSNQLMEITHLMKKFLGVYEIDDTKKWLVLLQIVNSYRKTIIVIVNMNFKRHHIS